MINKISINEISFLSTIDKNSLLTSHLDINIYI